jgi:hypothetical protein
MDRKYDFAGNAVPGIEAGTTCSRQPDPKGGAQNGVTVVEIKPYLWRNLNC